MANNLVRDHLLAFEEAYALSGDYVTIEGTRIRAILPLELTETQAYGDVGEMTFTGETNITVLVSDLPTIDAETIVTIGTTEYRITSLTQQGAVAVLLTIEKP